MEARHEYQQDKNEILTNEKLVNFFKNNKEILMSPIKVGKDCDVFKMLY